ncbi:MAG: CoA transferase [Actinomycetota bacterium]|nr:CoA transferase [Actinomycetota bacterium]
MNPPATTPGMLTGIRVLDLTQYLSGPTASLLLAGLGADVIKIEPGPIGDLARLLPVVRDGRSSYYIQQNRGKRSVCVDLGKAEGTEIVRDLAVQSDILIENFSLGVLDRRGLGADELRAANPRLIYVSISTYGRTGSRAALPGYDLIGQAAAGSVALTGEPDGAPIAAGVPIADVSAGMMAFGAIGHALFSRTETGEGQFLDISMVEAVFQMHPFAIQGPSVTEGVKRLRRTGRHFGSVPPAGSYQGPEGWLVLQVLDAQWLRLCDAAVSIGLGDDPRFRSSQGRAEHRNELVDIIEAWMQTFPNDDALLAHLDAHRVPAGRVVDPADAHLEPWYRERGALTSVEDDVFGRVDVPGFPLHGSAIERRETEPPAPLLGQHNHEVLAGVLGYDDARIARLHDDGVLIGPS